ncbi:MAG: hypothetical protein IJR54_05925 [Oscillibacter sp.]|nr:hypothetical protein [Oscillibacter sp.]
MKKNDAQEEIGVPVRTGFSLERGTLLDHVAGNDSGVPGRVALTPDEIRDSGGLPRALSRKSAAVIRESFQGLDIRAFPPDVLERWEYILPHFRPHMDEYLSSLFLRACLPDGMCRLKLGETFLTSRDNDPDAKTRWPRAAVLGIGGTVNGGAEPLLLFDEHEAYGTERESSSLVILMKRYLLGKQRPPYPFYQMLNEVNYIDMYGGGHAKNLATYVKYLNTLPMDRFGGEAYAPTWKAAVIDACLTAFYLGLREPSPNFMDRARWEPFLRRSIADYLARTSLKDEPGFDDTARKITRYLTTMFIRSQGRGELKLTMTDKNGNRIVKGRETGHETDLNLLVPYLPYLCARAWGGTASRLIMYFLWESRFYQELLFSRTYERLCAAIPKDCAEADALETPVGKIDIVSCGLKDKNGVTLKVYDLTSTGGIAPGPLNRYLRTHNAGFGLTLFRDTEIHSTVLTRGEGVDMGLWERLCDALIAREGASDMVSAAGQNGVWHVTRNPHGIAGFLLNGNPTHRYVPCTAITARSLARLAEECAAP